ncbi:DNA-processing protein DprA [Devosia algicola]|uniref:DNA-processing protein DprA n=1 Tax=Devosia algicola TaxID=3026418 RepID=A0ABY7YQD7_9HYPH|nr:DNA-processing protein DprA [Devosia algicola]WDR03397.1 DNA-processing protein DprA [Devosia algicola]
MASLPTQASLTLAQQTAWLRLIRTENVGPVTFRQLLNRFGSADAALEALPRLVKNTGKTPRITTLTAAEDEIAGLQKYGGRLVTTADSAYPPLLRHIAGAPPLLTMIGGKDLEWQRTVGIVGARNASAAGIKMTRLLCQDLGAHGYTIISGLARGIDAAAHKAALHTGTVAALAGGLDKIYPDDNIPLAHDIIDSGGALLTEMPLGWEPRARDFPRRNRLVSGMSLGIVVVEAAKRSGSLITARLALEQNRDVFAVPGSPLDPRAEGGNALIQQGARLIVGANDIVETLNLADPVRAGLFDREWEPDAGIGQPLDYTEPTPDDLTRLRTALSTTPVEVDELVQQSCLPVGTVQMLLLELDLSGQLEWSSGQLVALRP